MVSLSNIYNRMSLKKTVFRQLPFHLFGCCATARAPCSQPIAPISQQQAAEFISNATPWRKKMCKLDSPETQNSRENTARAAGFWGLCKHRLPPSGEPAAQTMSLNIYRPKRPAQNERKLVPHHNIELHEKATLDSFIIFQTSTLKMLEVDWIKFKGKKKFKGPYCTSFHFKIIFVCHLVLKYSRKQHI